MSLSSVSNIALSGMNAASLRMAASANNTANTLTPDYPRAVVGQKSVPGGGVAAKLDRVPSARTEGASLEAMDVVDRIGALYSFKANILSLVVADRMAGAVINLRA